MPDSVEISEPPSVCLQIRQEVGTQPKQIAEQVIEQIDTEHQDRQVQAMLKALALEKPLPGYQEKRQMHKD